MTKLTDSVKKVLLACETKDNGPPTLIGDGYLDTLGWKWVTWSLLVGALDTTITFKIQESDLPGSGYADVAGAALTAFAATDDNQVAAIEINLATTGRKRFQKPVCVVGDGDTGAALAIEAELGSYSPNVADVAGEDLKQVVAV